VLDRFCAGPDTFADTSAYIQQKFLEVKKRDKIVRLLALLNGVLIPIPIAILLGVLPPDVRHGHDTSAEGELTAAH